MHKWTKCLISIPVVALPWLMHVPATKAEVQNVGPTGAVKLLAQSRTVNAKCNHLSAREKSELSDYAAKAEVSVATTHGKNAATGARRSGVAAGKAMTCGRGSEELVRASLDAARRAMAQARAQARTRANKPRRRVYSTPPVFRRSTTPGNNDVVVRAQPPRYVSSASLTRYRRVATAYYLERRCQHLPRAHAVAFWKDVVASHRAVLRKYSSNQVAKAKADAERRARHHGSCGFETEQVVTAGFNSARFN